MASSSTIEKCDIQLPNKEDEGKLAFVLLNVFTPEECQEWIEISENHGYLPALVNRIQIHVPSVRNNTRSMIDDMNMADKLFQRIKPYLPNVWQNYELVGLNERLRFLRYDPGERFKRHKDGIFSRNDGSGEQSFITVQLYLNEGFEGGETTFLHYLNEDIKVPCVPRTGMVLIFQHDLLHEGSLLKTGRKYTIRTDVMYRPLTKTTTPDED